jgi:hypothetical protein
MQLFKNLCAGGILVLVWWFEISYVAPFYQGNLFDNCSVLFCAVVSTAAMEYVLVIRIPKIKSEESTPEVEARSFPEKVILFPTAQRKLE